MKRRNLFMAVALLMFGLNLEAKSLTATTPVAPSEVKSSQHAEGRTQFVLNVPVNIYMPVNTPVKYRLTRGNNTYSGVTTGKSLVCYLTNKNSEPINAKEVELHDGRYTVHFEFKGMSNHTVQRITEYRCWVNVELKESSHPKVAAWLLLSEHSQGYIRGSLK